MTEKGSVAIIGTGIAGLSCAFLLAEEGYQVTVLEKHNELGMDAHCVTVENNDGEMIKLNTPPRSFSRGYYPNLMELYRASGVEVEQWSWAWCAFLVGDWRPYFSVDRSMRFCGFSFPYIDVFRPFRALAVMMDGIRFSSAVQRDFSNPKFEKMTLAEYLAHLKVSNTFIYHAMLPTLAMVCTCSYESCLEYPATLVMEFFRKTSTYGQFRTKHGTADATAKLSAKVQRVKLGVYVDAVRRGAAKPSVTYRETKDSLPITESFDHIVMATQANHACQLLHDFPAQEIEVLQAFDHAISKVVIHRDTRVMPGKRSSWTPMSIGVLPLFSPKEGNSMFTIWMNDSFPTIKGDLFQTWNPVIEISPNMIVDRPISFERPVMTFRSLEAVEKLEKIQGCGGIWFCGAWNCKRIPLQESGVMSAIKVVRMMTGKHDLVAGTFVLKEDEQEYEKRTAEEELFETKLGPLNASRALWSLAFMGSAAAALFTMRRLL